MPYWDWMLFCDAVQAVTSLALCLMASALKEQQVGYNPASIACTMPCATGCCCVGGYFFGTVPDGKRVKAHLVKASGQVSQGHLMLKQEWQVRLQCFLRATQQGCCW
jgi:hypothetical protein